MTAAQKTTSTNVGPAVSPSKHTDAGKAGTSVTTPIRHAQAGIAPFTFADYRPADVVYENIGADMKDCFTGSMPWDAFVDTFYPIRGERPPLPELKFNVPLPCEDDPTSDISYYTERGTVSDFCRAINESGVCPSMDWVNTENVCIDMNGTLSTKDPKSKRKVDASGMEKPASGKLPVKPDFTRMKVAAEFKLVPQDPVVDADPEWTPEQRKEQGYVHQTANAIHARGQATSYALHSFSYKPRTHVTSLVIMGRWARLLRYDHSGVVVTERFDWRANKGRLLAEFLSRVEHANAREDGVDDSVGDVSAFSEEQLIEARKAMQEFSDGMLDVPIEDKAKLRSVKCWDDSKLDENGLPKSRTLIATEPLGVNYSIVGRYTTSFIGYDINTRCAYWVKDSWPIDRPGEFEKEGRIYERLVDAGVPHIAEVECAGEVRWKEDNMVQRTRTAEFVKADWAGLTANIHPLSHYRILFKDIGRPITKFASTHQLVTALSHAIEAHSVAYNDADVLHRDISAGNVLINRKGEGMLIDWDLALIYDNAAKIIDKREPRLSWRTGTWAFLSIALLSKPFEKDHELSDDLESFYWVLLYAVLRYRYAPPEWQSPEYNKTFQAYLLRLFEWKEYKGKIAVGGQQKREFLNADESGDENGHISHQALADMLDMEGADIPIPLGELLVYLRLDFQKFYARPLSHDGVQNLFRKKKTQKDAGSSTATRSTVRSATGTVFANSTHLMKRFTDAISSDGWRTSDASKDRFPYIHLPLKTRESFEKKAMKAWHTRSDNPTQRRQHDPTNNLHYEVSREDAAADARRRVGGDEFVIPKPAFGRKRVLDTVDEGDEESEELDDDSIAAVLERRDVSPPPKRQRRDSEGRPKKDAQGRRELMEAWSH